MFECSLPDPADVRRLGDAALAAAITESARVAAAAEARTAVAVAVVVALTFFGSGQLAWFDAALVGYLFGTVFAVFGVVYRYAVWLRRPPTAMLNRRGWDAFRARRCTTRRRSRRWSARTCWPRASSAVAPRPGG